MIVSVPALMGLVVLTLFVGALGTYALMRSYHQRRINALRRPTHPNSVLFWFDTMDARDEFLRNIRAAGLRKNDVHIDCQFDS